MIPTNWFKVTLQPIYTDGDKDFATWARVHDPRLLKEFVVSDINILCRDAKIKALQIRSYARAKFCLDGNSLLTMLGIPTFVELLAFLRDLRPRASDSVYTNIQEDGIERRNNR